MAELHTAAAFLEVSALAAAHERGAEHAVAEKWRRYLEPGSDSFLERLLSAPFEGLEFGQRSYDDAADGE